VDGGEKEGEERVLVRKPKKLEKIVDTILKKSCSTPQQ
jgi:hypothetical protein